MTKLVVVVVQYKTMKKFGDLKYFFFAYFLKFYKSKTFGHKFFVVMTKYV